MLFTSRVVTTIGLGLATTTGVSTVVIFDQLCTVIPNLMVLPAAVFLELLLCVCVLEVVIVPNVAATLFYFHLRSALLGHPAFEVTESARGVLFDVVVQTIYGRRRQNKCSRYAC